MKRRIKGLIISLILLLVIPVTLVITGFYQPAQFSETYYGELPAMFERLKKTEGKKIVLIGNSAVSFGVRSDLLQSEFPGYTVVNFGLYGAVGTKAMLDLSRVNIGQDDIIIIMPELYAQTSSLYFSAEEVYRAADGNTQMLRLVRSDDKGVMIAGFLSYVSDKYLYMTGAKTPDKSGIYSHASFLDENGNEAGYMTYNRPYNVMPGGYDAVNKPVPDISVFGEGFLEYLNAYAKEAEKKGAAVYYGFTPMNALSLDENAEEQAMTLYGDLLEKLGFKLLGTPVKYIMDHRWFYDNNVHMNSAGAVLFTSLLAEDLKIELGMTTPVSIEQPEMPETPVDSASSGIGVTSGKDADKFTYEIKGSATDQYVVITGLTEPGRLATELTIPSEYEGVLVREFAVTVFRNNRNISRIVLPATITTIYDDSFLGAERLTQLVFMHDSVLTLNIGQNYLNGADKCLIYLKKGVSVTDCAGGWAKFQERIRYYE